MISLAINTCCLGQGAKTTSVSGQTRGGLRDWVLRTFILPRYAADPEIGEIIVVGEYEPGQSYAYVECPSVHFNTYDTLAQRQTAFSVSSGEWIIFQHDDHMIGHEADWSYLDETDADIIVPFRYTRARKREGERINNGEPEFDPHFGPYAGGHCSIMRRSAVRAAPWSAVPIPVPTPLNVPSELWDVYHSKLAEELGLELEFTDRIRVYDVEHGAEPWN